MLGVLFRAVPLGLHFLLWGRVPRLIAWADIGPSLWDFGLISALIRRIRVIRGQKLFSSFVSIVDRDIARSDTVVVPTLAAPTTWLMLLASGPNGDRNRSETS